MNLPTSKSDRINRIILGLGNIGAKYDQTRHNIGFELADLVAESYGLALRPGQGDYYLADSALKAPKPATGTSWWKRLLGIKERTGQDEEYSAESALRIIIAKPTKYMNRSGETAKLLLTTYSLEPQQLLVVTDDFNLPVGAVRIRRSGSDGGHNGLKSIIYELGTDQFPRIRLGGGPKPAGYDVVDFVLGRFEPSEQEAKENSLKAALAACRYLLESEDKNALDLSMSKYNIGKLNPAPDSGS